FGAEAEIELVRARRVEVYGVEDGRLATQAPDPGKLHVGAGREGGAGLDPKLGVYVQDILGLATLVRAGTALPIAEEQVKRPIGGPPEIVGDRLGQNDGLAERINGNSRQNVDRGIGRIAGDHLQSGHDPRSV